MFALSERPLVNNLLKRSDVNDVNIRLLDISLLKGDYKIADHFYYTSSKPKYFMSCKLNSECRSTYPGQTAVSVACWVSIARLIAA